MLRHTPPACKGLCTRLCTCIETLTGIARNAVERFPGSPAYQGPVTEVLPYPQAKTGGTSHAAHQAHKATNAHSGANSPEWGDRPRPRVRAVDGDGARVHHD